jgi:hypothetical protein
MEQWFGKWKGMMVSIFTSLIIVLGLMTREGCCLIASMRGLIQRLIETTLTKQTPVSYPDNLLSLDTVKQESQLMLAKFKEKNCK